LYVGRNATTGSFLTGAVMQLNPTNGTIIQTVSAGLTCPEAISLDPLSGDLFTDDSCGGGGSNNPALWRISGLPSSPTTTVYATLPNTTNANIAFAPSGDMYIWDAGQGAEVTGTSGPNPPVVSVIPGLGQSFLGMLAFGMQPNGDANYLVSNFPGNTTVTPNIPATTSVFDLTVSPPTVGTAIINSGSTNGVVAGGASNLIVGPDGCIYAAQGTTIWRITDSNGKCIYTSPTLPASIVLAPSTFNGNATQGSPITLNATFHNAGAPAGTPIIFNVSGANSRSTQVVLSDANGNAALTYSGAHQGVDTIVASATAGKTALTSNQSVVTWGPGVDVTFLTLNASPVTATMGQSITLAANLTDVSAKPVAALAGQSVNFSLNGAAACSATTDANGNASCPTTATGSGIQTLAADFTGVPSQFIASSDTKGLNVLAPPLPTPTATPTPTTTPTPTATPTPVAGALRISPRKLNFGTVDLGSSKTKTVKVTNKGRITKKKHPVPILIEMESTSSAVFTVTMSCTEDDLGPKSKGVKAGTCNVQVTFTPTAAVKYTGNLDIFDNLEPGLENVVPVKGSGKAPKVK
ncbi:MAG: hypothetical protein ACREQD_00930, partial [Candidatus Binataceae bacterium]